MPIEIFKQHTHTHTYTHTQKPTLTEKPSRSSFILFAVATYSASVSSAPLARSASHRFFNACSS